MVAPKRPANDKAFEPKKKKKKKRAPPTIDEENYLHYRPKDFQSEKGFVCSWSPNYPCELRIANTSNTKCGLFLIFQFEFRK